MTFNSATTMFSDLLTINATFTAQNVNFTVQLYDANGSPLVYSPPMSTSNGSMYLTWDLKDNNGNQISFNNIQAFIYSDQGPVVKKWYTKECSTVSDGFVVAWGWNQYSSVFNQNRTTLMLNGVINIINDASASNEYTPLAPPPNAAFTDAFRYNSPADAETLLSALADSRNGNFFWFGHGNEDALAGNVLVSNIGAGDIEGRLQNKAYRSNPARNLIYQNKHCYRLVILNGCETYSVDFCNAFGIDFTPGASTQMNNVAAYNALERFPRAFVGWTQTIDVPSHGWLGYGDATQHGLYAQALAALFSDWMSGVPLYACMQDFSNIATANGFTGANTYSISGCRDLTR